MRKIFTLITACLLLATFFGSKSNAQKGPGGVGNIIGSSTLKLWLNAGAGTNSTVNGASISSWTDQSGYGFNASQANGGNQPTYISSSINGQPALSFNGSTSYLTVSGFPLFATNSSALTQFVVFNPSDISSQRFLLYQPQNNCNNNFELGYHTGSGATSNWGLHNGCSNAAVAESAANLGYNILSLKVLSTGNSPSNVKISKNGTALSITNNAGGWANAGNYGTATNTLFVGSRGGGDAFHNGPIAEVISYAKELSSCETILVENYLNAKYNISIANDKYAQPSATTYIRSVAGIGKESDGTNTSANSGGLLISDNSFLQDVGDYILVGYDNTATTTTIANIPSGVGARWTRDWFLDKTDVGTANGNVTLTFDFSGSGVGGTPSGSYSLIYRSTTSGNYSVISSSSTIINTDQVSFTVNASLLADGYYTIAAPLAVPTITSFSPINGVVGATVTISGSNFNTTAANNIVFFGSTQATVTSATSSSLTVTIPAGAVVSQISELNTGTGLAAYSRNKFTPTFSPGKSTLTSADFQNKVNFTMTTGGNQPSMLSFADLDGDGKADAVMSNQGSSMIAVRRNTSTTAGTISLGAVQEFPTFSEPREHVLADLDGDGKLDIATSTGNLGGVLMSVLRNTSTSGSISFAARTDYAAVNNGGAIVAADFDGDGKIDLGMLFGSVFSVYRNISSGPGTITLAAKADITISGLSGRLSVGDMDGDGKPDLVSSGMAVALNASTGPGSISFGAAQSFAAASSSYYPFLVDIDGDGKLDVAIGSQLNTSSVIGVFRNTSSGAGSVSFATRQDFACGSNPYWMTAADLNGDSKPDLVVPSAGSNALTVFTNTSTTGAINFATSFNMTNGANYNGLYFVASADLDGDGVPDLGATNQGGTDGMSIIRTALVFPPVISTTATLSAFSSCAGTPSASQSFSVSGINLTANLIVTAPTGFELSLSSGGSYSNSISVTPSGGTVANTNIFVRTSSVASGSPSGNISIASTGGTTQNVAVSATINTLPAATITAGSSTSLCTGNSVTLTASAGNSYLWSTGETSQSISVSIAGSYTVTVTNSAGCSAVSTPTVVTVNSYPVANITASGPTTFCAGGSVALTVRSGNALTFNGSNRVTVTSTPTLPVGNSAYTIETWVKPNTISGVNGLVGWGNYGALNQVNALRFNGPTTLINYWWSNDLSVTIPNILDGKWHHIVATYDGTTRAIYLDGVLRGSDVPSGHNVASGTTMTIAETFPAANEYFDGSMDEVRIWNIGKTQAQIAASMNATVPVNSAGLVAYYKLDEGSGLTTADATNNGNTGTLTVNPVWMVPSTSPVAGVFQSVSWSPGGATGSTLTVTTSGTYTATVTNAAGCSVTSTPTVITVNTLPTATISPSGSLSICTGNSVTLTASAGSSYLWSTGATTPSITTTTAGSYTVTVTNSSNCSANSAATTVSVYPLSTLSITPANPVICNGSSLTLNSTITGGTPAATPIVSSLSSGGQTSAKLVVGLRKLVSTYAGPAIRLRRSSDNTEANFGFSGNELDLTSISTFLGASTGFVTTLFDQSGNGGNITQTNTANQPTFVSNGLNGKPSMHMSSSQYMTNAVNYPSPFTVIYAAKQTGPSRGRMLSSVSNNWLLGWWAGWRGSAYFEGWLTPSGGTVSSSGDTNPYVYTGTSNGSNSSFIYQNGSSLANNANGITGPNGISLNRSGIYGESSDGDYTELFVFNTVLSTADRQLVENSAGTYYTIFGTSSSTPGPSLTVNPATTTAYTINAIDANGCAVSNSITVTVNPLPSATVSGTTTVCQNAAQPVITFTGSNATSPYTFTYTINGGAQQTVISVGNTATVSVPTNAVGTFTYTLVSVKDASSTLCTNTATGSAVVTVNALPTASIAGTTTVCQNAATNITFTGANGTSPYTFTYTINGGAQQTVTSVGNTATVSVPTGTAGTFTYALVSVKDASATLCSNTASGSAIVTVNAGPLTPIIYPAGPTAVCANNPVQLSTGWGLNFAGTDDKVQIAANASLDFSTGTLECWIKPNASTDNKAFLAMRNAVNVLRWSAHINESTNTIGIWNGAAYNTVAVPFDIVPGTWYHVALVMSTANTQVYVNGSFVGNTNNGINTAFTGLPFTIGSMNDAGYPQERFAGQMDEVRIWSTARTASEIFNNYNANISPATSGLLAYYKLNEGFGTTAANATGTGLNGTLVNNPTWVNSTFPTTAALTYLWSPGNQTTNSISVSTSGSYSVKVTDANGCFAISAPVSITVNPLPTASVSGTTTVCQNAASQTVTFTGANGTSPYTFTYSINGGAQQTVTSVGNTATVSVPTGTAGTFTYALVSVKDASATQCTNTATGSAVVTINALPVVTASSNSPVNAFGTLNLSASGANTYSWSGPNAFTANTATTSITSVSSANAGVYSVMGTNTATGCTNTATTNVVISFVAATGLTLDGVNDYISVPDNNSLDFGSGNFTIETWVNKRALSSNWANEFIVGKWNTGASPGTNEWDFTTGSTASNNLPTFLMEVGTTTYTCTGTTSLQLNTWYHLAVVRNGSSLKIYVNGILEGSITIPANAVINNTGLNMTMGAFGLNGHPSFFANMSIDEIRIWNRALCQAEIQNNKDCELNASGRTDLIALYHFNQGLAGGNNSGITTLTDASGNNFNGTLNSFALSGNTSNWTLGNASGNCTPFVPATTPITGITTVCLGSSSTLTNTTAGGVWSSSNPSVATIDANGVVSSLSAGTTVISYTNICGGVSSVTFTVNAQPVPIITAGGATTFCTGGSVTLTASAGSGYAWSNGATTQSITVNTSGTYTVTVTNASGCFATSAATTVTVNPNPTVSIAGSACLDGSAINVTSTNTSQIQWSLNGTPFNVPTSLSTNGVIVAGGNGQGAGLNQLNGLQDVMLDASGNVYISDQTNNRVIKWAPGATTGVVIAGGNGGGSGANQLNTPNEMVFDAAGNLYVTDFLNHRVQKWAPGATSGVTVAGGNGAGTALNQTPYPSGITIDASGNLYVLENGDGGALQPRVTKWAPGATSGIVVVNATYGSGANQLIYPDRLLLDNAGNLIIGDYNNYRVQKWVPGASFGTTVAGGNGVGSNANQLGGIVGMRIDASNNLYILNSYSGTRVVKWAMGAPSGTTLLSSVGLSAATSFTGYGLDIDASGSLYIADNQNARVLKFTSSSAASYTPTAAGTYSVVVTSPAGCTASSNTVVVNALPTFTSVPANPVVNSATGLCTAVVTYTATVSGVPTPSVTYTFSGATTGSGSGTGSGQTFNTGITTVTLTATNTCASISTTFTVTVNDVQAPVFNGTATTSTTVPAPILTNVPEASQYQMVYKLPIPNTAQFATQSQIPYSVNNAASLASTPFGRIAYYMELDNGKWVWVSMDKFTSDPSLIGIPTGNTVWQQKVTNMNIVASANSGLFTGNNISTGNIELWSWCYGTQNSAAVPGASNTTYDFGDQPSGVNCYGSFQVHNYGAGQTLFAYNSWANGSTADLGIGNNTGNTNPDWTFMGNASSYTVKNMYVFISGGIQNLTANTDPGQCSAVVTVTAPIATDNCGTPVVTGVRSDNLTLSAAYPKGITTIIWTATDASGNTATINQTVTVTDNQAPSITCPGNITATATSAAGAVVNYSTPVGTDNCPGVNTVRTVGLASGATFPIGTTTVTHVVTDAGGLTATCSFTVTVSGLAPQIICPANITVNGNAGQCGTNVSFAATETTGIPASTITYSIAPGSFFAVGTTTVTATATNAVGTSTCSFTVTVRDVTPPTIVCAANITINTTPGLCTATATLTAPTVSDNCSTVTNNALKFDGTDDNVQLSGQPINPSSFTVEGWINGSSFAFSGRYNRIVAINYGSYNSDNPFCLFVNSNGQIGYVFGTGNTPTDQQVPISTSPVLSTNTWYHIALTFDGNAKRLYVNGALVATINSTATFSNPNNEPLLLGDFKIGETNNGQWNGLLDEVRIWNVVRTQTQITANMNAELNAQPGLVAAYHFNQGVAGGNNAGILTASDASGNGFNGTLNGFALSGATSNWVAGQSLAAAVTVTNNAPATYPLGTTTVTWTATDAAGNSSTCNQTVTVLDNTPPTITGPSNITAIASSAAGAVVNYATPVGTDNCSGATTVLTTGFASGSTFPIGTTTVTYTVTDGAGLTAQTSFTVTVSGLAPQIVCPSNIIVNAITGQCGANVPFTATESTAIPASVISYKENTVTVTPGSFFSVGTHTITATATNAVGSSSCNFTITVVDNQPPVLVDVPADVTVECDAVPAAAVVTATDNCSTSVPTFTETRTNGSCANNYTLTRTWSTTDASGNVTTRSQIITVQDTKAPVITCPFDMVIPASNGICSAVANFAATATDNCGGVVTLAYSKASGSVFNLGTTTVTVTATDVCGNQSSCSFKVTVTDNQPPIVITKPITVALDATGHASITPADIDNGSNDNCGPVTLSLLNSGTICAQVNEGQNLTLTAPPGTVITAINFASYGTPNGTCGNFTLGSCNATNTKTIIEGLALNHNSFTVSATNGVFGDPCGGTFKRLYVQATYSGGSGGTSSTFDCSNLGNNNVTLKVSDANGNVSTGVAVVTVIDNIKPVITCPLDINVIATSAAGRVVTYVAPVGTDNCTVTTARTAGLASGSTFPIGATTVTHRATDAAGNFTECSFTITVSGLAPQINCPANITVNAITGQCGANVPFAATETVGIPASVIGYKENNVTVTPGSFFSVGTHSITATATNAVGNSSCNFTITVVDNQFPVLVGVPANVTVECDAVPARPVVTATDNCSTSVPTFTETRTNGNCPSNYILTRTWSTTDASGNRTTATQIITVQDTKAPVLSAAPADVTVSCDAIPAAAVLTAGDNCDAAPVVSFAETSTQSVDLSNVAHYNYTIIRVWTATDACGNASSKTQIITVQDVTKPVIITTPGNIATNTDAGVCGALINFEAAATDNCGPVTITYSKNPGTVFPVGISEVTITATDVSANVITSTFIVTVTDNENPTIVTINKSQNIDKDDCGAMVSMPLPVTGDNCEVATVINDYNNTSDASGHYPVGTTIVTWTVTDIHGNVTTATQQVTVTDNQAPVITAPADVTVYADNGICAATNVNLGAPVTGDNCGVASVTNNATEPYSVGTTVVTWTVTDVNGNVSTATQNVIVIDNQPPIITAPADITVTADEGTCSYDVNGTPSVIKKGKKKGVSKGKHAAIKIAGVTITDPTNGFLGTPDTGDNCGVASLSNDAPTVFTVGTTVVIWTVTDIHGNSSTITQTVVVTDDEDPTIISAGDQTQTADVGDCGAVVTVIAPTTNDNCGVSSVTNSYTGTSDASGHYPVGTTVVTWTVTDIHGNTNTTTQSITVTDNQPPVLVGVPENVTVECDAVPETPVVTATDNCSTSVPTFTETRTDGNCPSSYILTRTWSTTDASNNTTTATQVITVQDTQAPVLSAAPAAVTVNCDAIPAAAVLTAGDNCDAAPVVSFTETSTQSADLSNVAHYNYTITRVWTATDACGNASSKTQIITVQDVTKPVITVPASVTVNCQDDNTSASNGVATATDNCADAANISITQSDVSTYSADPSNVNHYNYTITRTWRATDVAGNFNEGVQTITVQDVTKPIITCPAPITVNCQDDHTSVATGVATATDNCADASTIVISETETSTYSADPNNVAHYNYVITRTWRATDVAGNYSECDQLITVQDVTAPIITCPSSLTLNCQDDNTSANTGVATATDICNDASTIAITQSDVSTYSADQSNVNHYNYVITRTWRATDVAGNYSECVQTITVHDVTAPIITCPESVIVNCQDNSTSTATGMATATDNCADAANIAITQSDVSTQDADITKPGHYNYTISRTWRATDVAGNYSECVQIIMVHDVTAPVITCPASVTVNCQDNSTSAATGTATATDNCADAANITITQSDVSTQDANLTKAGHYNYTITRTWRATDVSGNYSECVQTITVQDITVPIITCPASVTLNCQDNSTSAATGVATATDNCADAANIVITQSDVSTQNADITKPGHYNYVISRTWRATDVSGNYSECVQTITVQDVTAPIITCPQAVTANCQDNTSPASTGVATATDICSPVTISSSDESTQDANVNSAAHYNYTISRTWRATDVSGNYSECVQLITVRDITNPTFTSVPANISVNTDNNVCGAVVNFEATATDNCAPVTITYSQNPGTVFATGTNVVTITAMDPSGNKTVRTFTITVTDHQLPTVITRNITVNLDGSGNAVITAADVNNGSNDACGIQSISVSQTTFNCTNIGNNTVTLTVTDVNGNVSSATAVVTVQDKLGPVPTITTMPVITGQCSVRIVLASNRSWWSGSDDDYDDDYGEGYYYMYAPTASDNCSGIIKGYTTDPLNYYAQGTYTIHWKFTDKNGNTTIQEQTVIVKDNIAPKPWLTTLPTITGQCSVDLSNGYDGDDGEYEEDHDDNHEGDDDHDHWNKHHSAAPWARDNCAGWIRGTTTDPLTYTSQGTYVIHWTFNDGHGNITTQNQTVIVKDVTAPKPTVSSLPTINGQCSVTVTTVPTAKDNCAGIITATTTSPLTYTTQGTYTIVWKYTDGNGNTSTQNQIVVVKDNTKPVSQVTTLPTVTAECSATVTVVPKANDNCAGVIVGTTTDPLTYSKEGTYTIRWSYNDGNGNITTQNQTVVINDVTAPVPQVVSLPTITAECSATVTAPKANDNCAGVITGTTNDAVTYNKQGTYTIRWTYNDGNGNTSTQNQTVIIKDVTAPVVTVPANATINCGTSANPSSTGTASATDNCSGNINITYTDITSGNTITRTWKATDGAGNYSTGVQTITSVDNTNPVIADVKDVTVNCGTSTDPSATGTPKATDNCSAPTVSYGDVTSGNIITRTWKATDASGNSSTSIQIITIVDNTKPVISTLPNVTVNCGASTDPSATGTPTASDACSSVTISKTDVPNGNVITRTWKATDASGNYATSTQTITIGSPFSTSITSVPTNSTYTGGVSTNLYIGYGAQSTTLTLGSLPSSGAPYTYAWSGSGLSSSTTASPVFTPTTGGSFTFNVTVTNKYGCTAGASISICVNNILVPGSNGTKVYVCHTPKTKNAASQTLEVLISQVASHLNNGCGGNGSDRLGTCDQTPCTQVVSTSNTSIITSITKQAETSIATTEEELKVTVMPNPSTTYFTLKLESKYETPVSMRVMDGTGRVVDAKSKIGANSTIQIGHNYSSGTYYAELIQGTKRKVVQLIKAKG